MSKKRSTISPLLEQSLPVLLLDENLSSATIAAELDFPEDWVIERHGDHFKKPGTPDPEVLKYCGDRNWILVSADDRMRRVHTQAAEKAKARVFVFPRARSGREYRSALVCARAKLLRMARTMPPPHFARIQFDGSVARFPADAQLSRKKSSAYKKPSLEQRSAAAAS